MFTLTEQGEVQLGKFLYFFNHVHIFYLQAEELWRYFHNNMYPGEGTGLLRLNNTYRHDLKMYSSDEGRVQVSMSSSVFYFILCGSHLMTYQSWQMSAAAFAKGLLDLEGQLTPTLVSLVSKDSSMLDGLDNASIEMEEAKVVFLVPCYLLIYQLMYIFFCFI